MTIVGKSRAALAMICDILASHQSYFGNVYIYNNLNIPGDFKHPSLYISETTTLNEFAFVLGAVAPGTKKKIYELFPKKYQALVHKSAFVSVIDFPEGCLIDSNVSVAYGAQLGRFVTLYANCSIAHDSKLGEFVTVCPNAAICGNATIGEGTFIGAGAVIKNEIKIGKNCVIGCGAVVINDVPDDATVYGNPAKEKLENIFT